MNAPIQGTEADIIKIAMARAYAYIEKNNLTDVHLLLQVHDELVYEMLEKGSEAVIQELKRIMESVLTPKETRGVPILVEVKKGKSWGEMEEVDNL